MTPCVLIVLAVAAAYVTGAPVPNWLGLATSDGRDAIQLGDGCLGLTPGVNVLVDDDGSLRAVDPVTGPAPQSCVVVQRVHVSDMPCAQNPAGVCDVSFS
jgi:hypothetical protein